MTTSSYESLSHAKWDCKYHVVFIPKGGKKALYGKIRSFLGPVFGELAGQRGAPSWKGIWYRTMSTCSSGFRRSMRWPR